MNIYFNKQRLFFSFLQFACRHSVLLIIVSLNIILSCISIQVTYAQTDNRSNNQTLPILQLDHDQQNINNKILKYNLGIALERTVPKYTTYPIVGLEVQRAKFYAALGELYSPFFIDHDQTYRGEALPISSLAVSYWYKITAARLGGEEEQKNYILFANSMLNTEFIVDDINELQRWLETLANKGCSRAQYYLGLIYSDKNAFPLNYGNDYYKLFFKPFGKVNVDSLLARRIISNNNNVFPADYGKAIYWYGKAADQGEAHSLLALGIIYEQGLGGVKDVSKAAEYFSKAGDTGNIEGQLKAAQLYEKGVAKNLEKAFHYYLAAASQFDINAQIYVYKAYLNGIGVKQNERTALKWLLQVANLSNKHTQCILGDAYFEGRLVKKDAYRAYAICYIAKWSLLKPDEGIESDLKRFAAELSAKQIKSGQEQAILCYSKGDDNCPEEISEELFLFSSEEVLNKIFTQEKH